MRGPVSVTILALALGAAPLGAQDRPAVGSPSLDQVEGLADQGRIMAARDALEAWLELYAPSASREEVQRSIWLRGKLTVDPSMAATDFQRLVLEYPGGPYSDDALWRLGLFAEARGDNAEALRYLSSLTRDYPSSSLAAQARSWIQAHEDDVQPSRPPSPGNRSNDARPIPPPSDRSSDGRPLPSPSDRVNDVRRSPPLPTGEAPDEVDGPYAVQLGAFRSLGLARALVDQLGDAGYHARIVRTPANELAKVRVGRFPSRDGAKLRADELGARGFEVTIVSDAQKETAVGSRALRAPAPSWTGHRRPAE